MSTLADLYEMRRRKSGQAYIDAIKAKDPATRRAECARIVQEHQADSVAHGRRVAFMRSPTVRLTQEAIDGRAAATVRTIARTQGSAPEAEPA